MYTSGQNCKTVEEVYVWILSTEEEEKKVEDPLTPNEIREMWKMWEIVQIFIEITTWIRL